MSAFVRANQTAPTIDHLVRSYLIVHKDRSRWVGWGTLMIRISCAALLVLGMLTAAHAEMASCERETNVEIGECLTKQLAVVEHRLTDAYRKALASRTEAKWRSLVTASQRAWISSRDQDCRILMAYQWSGGSGEGAAVSQCLVQKDDMRVKELLAMASGG